MSATRKVVINVCYGGFGLSREAFLKLRAMGNTLAIAEPDIGEKWPDGKKARPAYLDSFLSEIPRDDPMLIQVVEEMGSEKASSPLARLRIVEIPANIEWEIDEYDGNESVVEKHRSWR